MYIGKGDKIVIPEYKLERVTGIGIMYLKIMKE
jgi:hypothetical protein